MQQPNTANQRSRELTDEEREARRQEQILHNQAALRMLDEWDQEDLEEQRETWELIARALKEYPVRI